jgi:type IV secretory pathway VirB2 component (pilin)
MKKFLLVFALILLFAPFVVSAQADSAVETICNVLQIAKTIVAAVGFGIAVILLIVAGIKYMTAGGDAEKAGSAKGAIINSVIGIVIVVAAVFIIGLAQGLVTDVGGTNLLTDPCEVAAP